MFKSRVNKLKDELRQWVEITTYWGVPSPQRLICPGGNGSAAETSRPGAHCKCPNPTPGKNSGQCQNFSPLAPLTPQNPSQRDQQCGTTSTPIPTTYEWDPRAWSITHSIYTNPRRSVPPLSCHSPQILPWNDLLLLFCSKTEGQIALYKEVREGKKKKKALLTRSCFLCRVGIGSSLK